MPTMSNDRPNIVYILADDWGYGDVSCLNAESKIPTPHTDRFASQGMTFTDAHSNSAVCTPTRYGVLTGRYCWRGRLKRGVLGGYDDLLIEDGRMTVASLLRDAGYRTACVGKWHLGLGWVRDGDDKQAGVMRDWGEDATVRFDQPLTAGPHTVGFDYSFIIPASLDIPPYCYIENGRVLDRPMGHVDGSDRPAFWRAGACARGLEHQTCLLELTMRAEQFIADHAREGSAAPFFLYLPLPSPHTPHVPRKPFRGASQCGTYGDYVVEHDWSIGRVLETLDRHGLSDDTLVVITSDNGAHMRGTDGAGSFDYEREFGHRSNHIYRGQKSDAWDGGHRVPFFARWPGRIEAGSSCDQPVCLTDLLATCAHVLGVDVPADVGEDSVSMLPLLDGGAEPTRTEGVHHSISGQFAIRRDRWKLLECAGSGGWSLPDSDAVAADAPPMQLYDMAADPAEQHNVIDAHRDVADALSAELNRIRGDDAKA